MRKIVYLFIVCSLVLPGNVAGVSRRAETRVVTRGTEQRDEITQVSRSVTKRNVNNNLANRSATVMRSRAVGPTRNRQGVTNLRDARGSSGENVVDRSSVVARSTTGVAGAVNTSRGTAYNTNNFNVTRVATSSSNTARRAGALVASGAKRARTAKGALTSAISDMAQTCKAQYTECMDNYCNVLDDKQGRCSCSKNIKNYAKTENALELATESLQDVAQKIQYIGLSKDEIETLFAQTEAEITMQGSSDSSQIKSDLDKIKNMISDVKSGTASSSEMSSGISMDLSGLLNFNIVDTGFDLSSLFGTSTANTSSISNQRGEDLYRTAVSRCRATVLNNCASKGVDIAVITNSYDMEIDKQCVAYERTLNEANDQMKTTIRNAQSVLQRARLMVAQQKNTYDLRGCVNALDSCMQDEFVCGTDYENCLDPSGKYIVDGEVVVGSTPGYKAESLAKSPGTEYSSSTLYGTWYYNNKSKYAWATDVEDGTLMEYIDDTIKDAPFSKVSDNMSQFLQYKIGFIDESGKKYGMCSHVLNKCQYITFDGKIAKNMKYNPRNDLIREYLSRTLVLIKKYQDRVIADHGANCMTDVKSCITQNNYSVKDGNVAINSCRSSIITCMSINGDLTKEPSQNEIKAWVDAIMNDSGNTGGSGDSGNAGGSGDSGNTDESGACQNGYFEGWTDDTKQEHACIEYATFKSNCVADVDFIAYDDVTHTCIKFSFGTVDLMSERLCPYADKNDCWSYSVTNGGTPAGDNEGIRCDESWASTGLLTADGKCGCKPGYALLSSPDSSHVYYCQESEGALGDKADDLAIYTDKNGYGTQGVVADLVKKAMVHPDDFCRIGLYDPEHTICASCGYYCDGTNRGYADYYAFYPAMWNRTSSYTEVAERCPVVEDVLLSKWMDDWGLKQAEDKLQGQVSYSTGYRGCSYRLYDPEYDWIVNALSEDGYTGKIPEWVYAEPGKYNFPSAHSYKDGYVVGSTFYKDVIDGADREPAVDVDYNMEFVYGNPVQDASPGKDVVDTTKAIDLPRGDQYLKDGRVLRINGSPSGKAYPDPQFTTGSNASGAECVLAIQMVPDLSKYVEAANKKNKGSGLCFMGAKAYGTTLDGEEYGVIYDSDGVPCVAQLQYSGQNFSGYGYFYECDIGTKLKCDDNSKKLEGAISKDACETVAERKALCEETYGSFDSTTYLCSCPSDRQMISDERGGCKCPDSYYMDPSNVSCVSKELCEHKSNPGIWDDSTHICTCPSGSVIKSGLCVKCPDGTDADTEKEVCVLL